MLENVKAEDILFLDIETVPQFQDYELLTPEFQSLWCKKAAFICKPDETPASVYQKAGIYAEFGKIVCISAGMLFLDKNVGEWNIRLKSFFNHDEKVLLEEFINLVHAISLKKDVIFCAHNGKEFDFPYMARRILINRLKLPKPLDISGKKPWEINHLDTLELWRFGDYKHYTSLSLLTSIFGIPTPKDDIDGSMVADVYYKENDLKRIVRYCEKDVLAVAQLFLRYKGETMISEEGVTSATLFV
ncbi:MAG TPA: 3'-5' exonuclease [Bacteroidales bacterium]|nr:3'-5' exonuclease [Bacteroidales bacterium]